MTAVHQFVPTLAPRDAVGGHYLAVQDDAARRRLPLRHLLVRGEGRVQAPRAAVHVVPRRAARRADLAAVPLVGRVTGRRLRRRPRRAADRRLPQHHARAVLHALGAAVVGQCTSRAGASSPTLEAARRSRPRRLRVQRAGADAISATGARRCVPILFDVAALDRARRRRDARPAARGTRRGGSRLVVRRPPRAEQGATRHRQGVRRVPPALRSTRARLHLVGGSSSHRYETALARVRRRARSRWRRRHDGPGQRWRR